MNWDRITMLIGTVSIIVFACIIFTPITNVSSSWLVIQSDIQPSDAIVVLGSGLARDGSLSYESAQRLDFAIRLYKEGIAPLFIVSGPVDTGTPPESTVRARIATEMGIPPEVIFEINTANTTREEAQQTAALLAPRKLRHILLVTEALHMRRSKMVFEAAGLTVSPAPSDNFPKYATSIEDRVILLRGLLVQSAGLLYYRIAGFI